MGVTFVGRTSVEVDPENFPTDKLRETFRCSSGDPIPGEWQGASIRPFAEAARVLSRATHVHVRGSDGFTVCLPMGTAIDTLIAFDRGPLDGSLIVTETTFPRFVASGIPEIRTVKSVDWIETLRLEPEQDAEEFEDLLFDP